MTKTLILNATYVNEKKIQKNDIYIENQKISRIDSNLRHLEAGRIFDASGLVILPGLIDDQVHFREPGLTAKGDIRSESAAAVAGGQSAADAADKGRQRRAEPGGPAACSARSIDTLAGRSASRSVSSAARSSSRSK